MVAHDGRRQDAVLPLLVLRHLEVPARRLIAPGCCPCPSCTASSCSWYSAASARHSSSSWVRSPSSLLNSATLKFWWQPLLQRGGFRVFGTFTILVHRRGLLVACASTKPSLFCFLNKTHTCSLQPLGTRGCTCSVHV